MAYNLDKMNKTQTVKASHESDSFSSTGGVKGFIRDALKGSIKAYLIGSFCVLTLTYMGVNSTTARSIGNKLAAWDIFGAATEVSETVEVESAKNGTKNELLNIHPIFKSAFAEDFLDYTNNNLSSKAKFKIVKGVEVLISKKRYGASSFGDAAKNCDFDFSPVFYPVSMENIKLNITGQRSWSGGHAYKCIAKIEYLD